MPAASKQELTQSLEPRGHDAGSQGQERVLDPGSGQGRFQQGQERVDQNRDILGQARGVLGQDGVQQAQRRLQFTVQLQAELAQEAGQQGLLQTARSGFGLWGKQPLTSCSRLRICASLSSWACSISFCLLVSCTSSFMPFFFFIS